ncbi:pentatricopeptide repeat-containing protein At4g19220, mitochondrial [Oryza brachyantha]|uniref:Pentatricopeptide repeat-containing protein n=1 Tax=Oryza brachyantha TaxID=4533 RepID=J3L7P2_ORYBR|nr:pentatricopeptide repeat-containing protein At4g19220, mitochondrial [Oryza brachyantha]
MLRRIPGLLAPVNPTTTFPSIAAAAAALVQTACPSGPFIRVLPARSHHAPAGAHHLLDGTPCRAGSIVRALGAARGASLEADGVAGLHCAALKSGAVLDPPVRTSVLSAYARARDVRSALQVFDEAAAPDLIMWNAAIGALTFNCRYSDAVDLFRRMVGVLEVFDSTSMVIMLSGASRARSLEHGIALHGMALKRCLQTDLTLWNALIDMYAKCGDFYSSEAVFQRMPYGDTASWNSMISGSLFNGLAEVSACYFKEMIRSGFQADEVSLSAVLSACCHLENLFSFGESVHGSLIKLGYEDTASCSVTNSLITFYSEFGVPDSAEEVFVRTSNKNLVTWNAMIKGMIENERVKEAMCMFQEMISKNQPDVATLVTMISACGDQGILPEGKELHGYIIRKGHLFEESSVGNSLLHLYMKCNDPYTAHVLFRTMPIRDLVSWNTMISGYSRNGSLGEEAKAMFNALLSEGLRCTLTTVIAVIPSCSCPQDLNFGKSIHSFILKYGFLSEVSAANSLIHMYICCGDSLAAFSLLKNITPLSDIISWNTAIVCCVQNGLYRDALEAFKFMHSTLTLNPDSITIVSILSVCGSLKLQSLGKSMHCIALKHLIAFNLRVNNALLTMYFRFADTESAELIFSSLGDRNLCTWNCMISGFAQNNEGWRALQFYKKMEDFEPNEISIVGIICACTQLGDLRQGKIIHGYALRFGLQTNAFISASLVDMYSKCGRLDISIKIFESSAEKSIACWNSMISAFGFHGLGLKSIEIFWMMNNSGMRATRSTFIALLSACSHSGLIDEGWKYYHLMTQHLGIVPTPEHNVCIVDMLGRAGRLQEAHGFVESLPSKQAHGVWGALLSACSKKFELKMGESIAKYLLCLEPEHSGYYVTMSNLYACQDVWSGAVQVRDILQDKGLMKPRGHSIIG